MKKGHAPPFNIPHSPFAIPPLANSLLAAHQPARRLPRSPLANSRLANGEHPLLRYGPAAVLVPLVRLELVVALLVLLHDLLHVRAGLAEGGHAVVALHVALAAVVCG